MAWRTRTTPPICTDIVRSWSPLQGMLCRRRTRISICMQAPMRPRILRRHRLPWRRILWQDPSRPSLRLTRTCLLRLRPLLLPQRRLTTFPPSTTNTPNLSVLPMGPRQQRLSNRLDITQWRRRCLRPSTPLACRALWVIAADLNRSKVQPHIGTRRFHRGAWPPMPLLPWTHRLRPAIREGASVWLARWRPRINRWSRGGWLVLIPLFLVASLFRLHIMLGMTGIRTTWARLHPVLTPHTRPSLCRHGQPLRPHSRKSNNRITTMTAAASNLDWSWVAAIFFSCSRRLFVHSRMVASV